MFDLVDTQKNQSLSNETQLRTPQWISWQCARFIFTVYFTLCVVKSAVKHPAAYEQNQQINGKEGMIAENSLLKN